jgi:hypothetical protein
LSGEVAFATSPRKQPRIEELMILASFVLMRAGTFFVSAYYDVEIGDYRELPPWNELRDQGEPIYLGLADQRGDKWTVNLDIKGGSVYPNQNLLTGGNDNRDVSFETLHEIAQRMGYKDTFSREVLIHMGGSNPWKRGLQALPQGDGPWRTAGSSDYAKGLIEKAGGEIDLEFPNEIIFWLEDEILEG